MEHGTLGSNVNPEADTGRHRTRRESGTVKWYNAEKGYGMIERDKGGELFVSISKMASGQPRSLNAGQRVEYTVEWGDLPKKIEPPKEEFIADETATDVTLASVPTENATTIILIDRNASSEQALTPRYLADVISPYLQAIAELQQVINDILGKQDDTVWIKSISQNSPISVSLQGVGEVTEVVRDIVVPWRRKHDAKISELAEQEKSALVELHKAEVLERRAVAQKDRAEARKVEAEAEKIRAEANKVLLENEKLHLEIHEARINLALNILERFAPTLSEVQKIAHVMELLEPLGILTTSSLSLAPIDEQQADENR